MYDSLCRRGGPQRIAGAHARQVPIDANFGDRWDFLRRHVRKAREAARGTNRQRRDFAAGLLSRAADPRNLMCAVDHLAGHGAKAPGPSGLRLEGLSVRQRWTFVRAISRELLGGNWSAGPTRARLVPKTTGTGHRPIEVANAEDRIVHRATAQMLQPLLDPQFDERSFGFRPGLDRQHALAEANTLALQHTGLTIKEDLRSAFGNIPHSRLLDVLRRHGLDEPMLAIIARLIANPRGRGIPQGGCLCPLLLNVYLDWHLDRTWRQRLPDVPLVRYADDLLIFCQPDSNGRAEYAALQQITLAAGMPLKGNADHAIVDLQGGNQLDWLGYLVSKGESGLIVRIGNSSWDRLRHQLERLHSKPGASLRARESVLGWIEQLGPCYRQQDIPVAYRRVAAMAAACAFEELPGLNEFGSTWRRAYARYCSLRRVSLLRVHGSRLRGRFAYRDQTSALGGRGTGVIGNDTPAPSLSTTLPAVTLYTDGSCLGARGVGGWAFILERPLLGGQRICGSDSHPNATCNRMELLAVIKGLQALESPTSVRVVTDSEYVYHGLTERLPRWRENRWRRCGGGQLANAGLWQRLERLLEPHLVVCECVRGHGGHPTQDECDVMARQAAQAGTSNAAI